MLANYVGEDVFLKGVSIYLKKHLYGNSVTNDLWSGVAEASGIDVPGIMNNWVTKVRTSLHARGAYSNPAPRWAIQSSRLLKLRAASACVRTDSSSLALPRKKIIKPSGTFPGTNVCSAPIELGWCRTVPLSLLSVGKDGKPAIDNSLILDTREKFISLDTTKPYKLNANTTGVCMSGIVWLLALHVSHPFNRSRAL